jgi:hypothetical protein
MSVFCAAPLVLCVSMLFITFRFMYLLSEERFLGKDEEAKGSSLH